MRTRIPIGTTIRLAIIAVLLGACQSYHPVTLPIASHLPNDAIGEVRVTEKNGKQSLLIETRIDRDSLLGRVLYTERHQAIALSDIATLETAELDGRKTVVYVVGGTVVTVLTLAALLVLVFWGYDGH